jgi:hypothetical protein
MQNEQQRPDHVTPAEESAFAAAASAPSSPESEPYPPAPEMPSATGVAVGDLEADTPE